MAACLSHPRRCCASRSLARQPRRCSWTARDGSVQCPGTGAPTITTAPLPDMPSAGACPSPAGPAVRIPAIRAGEAFRARCGRKPAHTGRHGLGRGWPRVLAPLLRTDPGSLRLAYRPQGAYGQQAYGQQAAAAYGAGAYGAGAAGAAAQQTVGGQAQGAYGQVQAAYAQPQAAAQQQQQYAAQGAAAGYSAAVAQQAQAAGVYGQQTAYGQVPAAAAQQASFQQAGQVGGLRPSARD